MVKKKVKPNAFSVFMQEIIAKERKEGRIYPKEEWATITKPYYDKLTPEEKEIYKRKAKGMPVRVVNQPPKYSSQGIPIEQIEREQRELAEKKRYMERKIKNIVENGFLDNDIRKKPFVFIMANYFYKTSSGIYSPAEVAIIKFNFEDAIYKKYQTFVNPGTVAVGYAFEAKDRFEKVHRLPPPPEALGEKSFEKVYAAILDVIGAKHGEHFEKNDSRRPCIFIRKEDIEMIESILDQLSDKQWQNTFDVFELELLFNELKNKVENANEWIRVTVTNTFIEQDRYDATPNISCHHHESEDATRHCALSYVQRWFFLFADHICEKINVRLVTGRHLPNNAGLAPIPFDSDRFESSSKNKRFDNYSHASGSVTGYSKLIQDSDDDSDDY